MYQIYTPTELLSNQNIFLPLKNPIIQTKIDETKEKIYQIILQNYEKIDPIIREENVINANSHQLDLITQKMKSQVMAKDHEFSRKLIAYYRNNQIRNFDRGEILEVFKFIKYYVENDFSPIYDEFGMVMRFPDITKVPDWFEYNFYKVNGLDFITLTNIFADTIHISNGTPEGLPGTVNILGTTAYNRWRTKFENIVHLPLEYQPTDVLRDFGKKEEVFPVENKKLFTILPKVLESIRKAENLHLQNLVK